MVRWKRLSLWFCFFVLMLCISAAIGHVAGAEWFVVLVVATVLVGLNGLPPRRCVLE